MKRVRQWARRRGAAPVRFFMCGEYGEQFLRPHFHVICFGLFFPDREVYRKLPSGATIYRSKELEVLWRCGFSSIGDVTFESAAYVARYAAKSALSGHDGKRRSVDKGFVDGETGEFVPFVPEFCRMSLKPGIGARWQEKYVDEIFPSDRVRINGVERGVPRYYDKLLERASVFAYEYVAFMRQRKAEAAAGENTASRLRTREVVVKAGLRSKVRTL